MRLLRVTVIAAIVAAIATVSEAVRPYQLRHLYEQAIDHQSGGLTASATRIFMGTDTGTMEERSHDGFLLDVRNTYVTGSGTSTFSNATNRLSSFSQLAAGVSADVFYFCSEDDNGVYRYAVDTAIMTRMVGDGTPGLVAGTGTTGRIDCGTSAVQSTRDEGRTKVYMFSGRPGAANYAIVAVTANAMTGVDGGVLAILAGSGTFGHTDATGTSAQIQNLHGMLFYKDAVASKEFLIMAFDDTQGPIRYIDIGTGVMKTTKLTYDANVLASGADSKAKVPVVVGLVQVPGQPAGFGITTNSRAFSLTWQRTLESFSVVYNAQPMSGKWGAAIQPNGARVFFGNVIPGNGTVARFDAKASTQSKTVPPTRTHTQTITPPSKTHPRTRTHSKALPTPVPTPTPPTPVPATPSPNGITTVAPGVTTNTTIDAAAGSSLFVATVCAAAVVLSMIL